MPADTATAPLVTIFFAMPFACFNTSASGTTLLTRPSAFASGAISISPVSINSIALAFPINLGRRCVPPKPGMIPRLISGWPSLTLSPATRIWHAIASSSPPPRHTPLIAAIVGLDESSSLFRICCPFVVASMPPFADEIFTISLISAPATKNVPEPVTMIAFASLSFASSSSALPSSVITAALKALAGGLLMVIVAIFSSIT